MKSSSRLHLFEWTKKPSIYMGLSVLDWDKVRETPHWVHRISIILTSLATVLTILPRLTETQPFATGNLYFTSRIQYLWFAFPSTWNRPRSHVEIHGRELPFSACRVGISLKTIQSRRNGVTGECQWLWWWGSGISSRGGGGRSILSLRGGLGFSRCFLEC